MPLTAEQKAMYMAMQLKGEHVRRTPGQIDGQQFIVDGLEDCTVEVLDHCAQVTVDDAKRSTITIGPCEDSLFVRDCEDCVIHAVCRQLRTRNCVRCKFYLWVLTDPIIESSHSCEFGEWNTAYARLDAQFKAANLDVNEDNLCHKIYDFTPDEPNSPHWTEALPQPARVIELPEMDSPPVNPASPKLAAPLPDAELLLPPEPPPRDLAERPLPPDPPAVQVEYVSTDDSSSEEACADASVRAGPADKVSAIGTTVESFVHEGGPGSSQPIEITFENESLGLSLVGCDGTGAVVDSPDVICAAVAVTAIKPESELHGVGVDIRGRMICEVDRKPVNGLSFHETIERILTAGRPITISFGMPPFTLKEGCAAMEDAAVEELVPETNEVLTQQDSPAAQTRPLESDEDQLPYRLTSDTGRYVALDTVGFFGQSIRGAAYEDARRYGRVRKGMQLHALATMLRRRTDQPVIPGENPRKFVEDETLSEVWIKVHYLAAPRCEGWALVRRGTNVYMEKQDDTPSPGAGPDDRSAAGGGALTSGMRLLSMFTTKKGISRKEEENVRQLILERERASMQELVAEELEERGIEVVKQPMVPHYQAIAVVGPGETMNVDVGGLGVMTVTVPKHCKKGDTFLFTIPEPERRTGDSTGPTSAAPPVSNDADEDDIDGTGEGMREWIAATRLDVGDVVDVMPSAMTRPAVEEAGLKFNKAREKHCEARGIVTEMTMSGNAKVEFATPVNGPDGEFLRTDTAHLAFPLSALALVEAHVADSSAPGDSVTRGLDLAKMDHAATTNTSSAADASMTPGVDPASSSRVDTGEAGVEEEFDTPSTPGTPSGDPPPEETPARGHLTGLDAGEIEIEVNLASADTAPSWSSIDEDAKAAAAAAKDSQATRRSELEQAHPEYKSTDGVATSLQAGWEKDMSSTTGQIDDINSVTGESTHDIPSEAALPELSEGMLLMQAAQALAGEDKWAACAATVRRAIEAGVDEPSAALYLEGVAQTELGNLAQAVQALRQCVQAEPEHEWAKDELSELEVRLQQQSDRENQLKSEQEKQDQHTSVETSSFDGVDDFGVSPAVGATASAEPTGPSSASLTITTSADLTVDVRYDVIVNSVSPEFRSTGSDSGINYSVWKTLTGFSDDGAEKPPPITYDQTEFMARNGGAAPTYGDVLWSEVPSGSVPAGSALKYIVHALAPDRSRRPKRLPSGLDREQAFATLVAVYLRAMWQATILGGSQSSIGMPPLGSGVFANDAADVMRAAVLAHVAYLESGGTASVSVVLWSPDGAAPKDLSDWETAAAAAPTRDAIEAALRESLVGNRASSSARVMLLSQVPKAHTSEELTALLEDSSELAAADFLAARSHESKAKQKELQAEVGAGKWDALLSSLGAEVKSSPPFAYPNFPMGDNDAVTDAAMKRNALVGREGYLCSAEFLHFDTEHQVAATSATRSEDGPAKMVAAAHEAGGLRAGGV